MKHLWILIPTLLAGGVVYGQKAYPVALVSLYSKVPPLTDSKACYSGSRTETDPNSGLISIKDNGPQLAALQEELMKISGAPQMTAAPTGGTPPSAEQIQQMQQQAMQRAMAAQAASQSGTSTQQRGTASGAPSSADVAVMKQIGQAQTSAGRINQLSSELGQKISALRNGATQVKAGPNCPEVQQGGYAGPTCSCQVEHATTYAKARVAAQNAYMAQVQAILTDYLGKFKAEAAVIDNMEEAAKYGDAVSNPAYRSMCASIQRQALAGYTSMLSYVSGIWGDGAKEYAGELNAESGVSTGCRGRK